MDISNQFFSEKLIEGYVKAPLSLKQQTLTKLAIQLCQYSDLKKYILCTSKPVRGNLYCAVWYEFITEKSSAMCDTLLLPHALKEPLMLRIRTIALGLFGWNKEHGIRLGMTSHVVDQFLVPSDWTVEGRINGRKVAERLVKNEKISVPHRYQLACIHFLEPFIRPLWKQITVEGRIQFYIDGYFVPYSGFRSTHFFQGRVRNLVSLWSDYLAGMVEELIGHEDIFWQRGFEEAVREGQTTAVTYCWNVLSESRKQEVIIRAALSALSEYCNVRETSYSCFSNIEKYSEVCVEYWEDQLWRFDEWCAMPEHYSDIMYFLFSQMSEDQKVDFFRNAFESNFRVFECFLQSPHQSYFMSVVTKLWGILPERYYTGILFTLSNRYTNDKKYQDCDYGLLLIELLQGSPEQYKRYIFKDQSLSVSYQNYVAKELFLTIFRKKPFEKRVIEIIHSILQQASKEEKLLLIDSCCGKALSEYLIENRNQEVLDSILAYSLPEEGIPDFKKKFLTSETGLCLCFRILAQENEESVNSLFHWGYLSEMEIIDIKSKLISTRDPDRAITKLLENLKMDCVDRIIQYCLPSECARRKFKEKFLACCAKDICCAILRSSQCDNLTQFLTWAFSTEQVMNSFRDVSFSEWTCIKVLTDLVRSQLWENADFLVKWSGFNPEGFPFEFIKENVMHDVRDVIFKFLEEGDTKTVALYLKWGLSDIERAKSFKNKFNKYIIEERESGSSRNDRKHLQRTWDRLMEDHLGDLANRRSDAR